MRFLNGPAKAGHYALVCTVVCSLVVTSRAQDRKGFDTILDTDVRDGFVYYRALKSDRGRLDAYVAQLADVNVDTLSRDAQIAFWLNAYDALVLRTVIDHYPIAVRSKEYPAKSIRQIPGAFERLTHRVGRSTLTLDQIEQNMLSSFHDPRLFFAIGRGAVGGGRLRSEAFTPEALETQLTQVAAECVSRSACVLVDRENNKLTASPIFSWREKDFAAAYAGSASAVFANRSPIERAIIGFVEPKLLTIEKDHLAKNANSFQLAYAPFDWTLNDLTGRGGR
jgi:uncharacterized protein DUF547